MEFEKLREIIADVMNIDEKELSLIHILSFQRRLWQLY